MERERPCQHERDRIEERRADDAEREGLRSKERWRKHRRIDALLVPYEDDENERGEPEKPKSVRAILQSLQAEQKREKRRREERSSNEIEPASRLRLSVGVEDEGRGAPRDRVGPGDHGEDGMP